MNRVLGEPELNELLLRAWNGAIIHKQEIDSIKESHEALRELLERALPVIEVAAKNAVLMADKWADSGDIDFAAKYAREADIYETLAAEIRKAVK